MRVLSEQHNFDAQDAVKYIYCILDEITNSVNRLDDFNDAELLPLLTRVESALKYHHYLLFQALSMPLINSFCSWCFHRLLLIACRPHFTYHLQTVGELMKRLLLVLERHHLKVFTQHSSMLLIVLRDVLNAMERFDDSGLENFTCIVNHYTTPSTETMDKSNFEIHLTFCLCSQALPTCIASFQAYAPALVEQALHSLCLTVELTDILGKQCALDAMYQTSTCLLSSSQMTMNHALISTYLSTAVNLVLSFLACSHQNQYDIPIDQYMDIQLAVIRCLNLLSTMHTTEDSMHYQGNLLYSMCLTLLTSGWMSNPKYHTLKHTVLDYVLSLSRIPTTINEHNSNMDSVHDHLNREVTYFIRLAGSQFVLTDCLSLPCCSIHTLEHSESKIETFLSARFSLLGPSVSKQYIKEYSSELVSTSLSVSEMMTKCIQLSRILGAIPSCSNLISLWNDKHSELSTSAIESIMLKLPRPNNLLNKDVSNKLSNLGLAYAALRLLSKILMLIPQEISNSKHSWRTIIQSILDWVHELESLLNTPSDLWIHLCGPTIHLLCVIAHGRFADEILSVESFCDTLTSLTRFYMTMDQDLNVWFRSLIHTKSFIFFHEEFQLTILQTFYRKLVKSIKPHPLTQPNALFMAHLCARILCSLCNCSSNGLLYCPGYDSHNHAQDGSTLDSMDSSSVCHSSVEYVEFLSLMLETRNIDATSDVLLDFAVYLASHLQWKSASIDQIKNFFVLIQTNLPHFTPAIIRKIYMNASTRLSLTDLGNWLVIHNQLTDLLNKPAEQGPSSALPITSLAEYQIMSFGALACCLAKRYSDLLLFRQSIQTGDENSDGRISNEGIASTSGTVSSTYLTDVLVSVIAMLCRLGIQNQYMHVLFGAVYIEIKNVVNALCLTPAHVLRLCQNQIAQVVADHMDQSVAHTIDSLSRLFDLDKANLFKELISPLFIALVVRGNQESHLRIRQLVSEIPFINQSQDYVTKVVQLCVLPEVIVYIFVRTSKEEQAVHLAFLEAHLNMSIERIARLNDVSRLMHQFILRLYPYRVGACLGLRWVASNVLPRDSQFNMSSAGSSKGPILADFLGHYVCGILAFFDNMLLDDDVMLEHRWTALRSLVVFIQLLGSVHVTRMRAKFIANLKICLRYNAPPFAKIVIKAWRSFIRMLEPEALSELLPDVGATLVGLLPNGTNQITDLFHYLFLEKKDQLGERLSSLFFLPRLPALLTCHQILDDICPWRIANSIKISHHPESTIRQLLSAWLSALTHSSRSVRRLALSSELSSSTETSSAVIKVSHLWGLSYLIDRCISSSTWFDTESGSLDHASNSEGHTTSNGKITRGMSVLLGDLVASLLEGSTRDTDQKMRLLYSQWLGNLGAIDPSKISSLICDASSKRDDSENVVFVSDRTFPVFVLGELAKIFLRAASPKQLDSAALAVQELLKLFEVTGSTKSALPLTWAASTSTDKDQTVQFVCGSELWNSFPEHFQDLFAPLLTSKYAVEAFTDWTTVQFPLIKHQQSSLTYELWTRLWSGSLSSHIQSPYLFRIFQFCEPVVKADSGFARLMLEHAALQVLLDNSQNGITCMHTEIMAVLTMVSDANQTLFGDSLNIGPLNSLSHANKGSDNKWEPWLPLAVQTIFGLLDHLRLWLRGQQQAQQRTNQNAKTNEPSTSTTKNHSSASPEAIARVSAFLASIPNALQANASLRCGALARALFHWELAYGEDAIAQQSAFVSGAALDKTINVSSSNQTVGDVPNAGLINLASVKAHSHSHFTQRISLEGLGALNGLLDTYAALRDTDGLAGVLSVSQLASSLRTQNYSTEVPLNMKNPDTYLSRGFSILRALELENEGQLDMAAAAYEHNLASSEYEVQSTKDFELKSHSDVLNEENRLLLYSGLFRCELPDPARLHGLVERAGALIRRSQQTLSEPSQMDSAWARSLNAYRAEAAWRLADWGTLKEITDSDLSEFSWSVELGRLFLAIKDKRSKDSSQILSQLRLHQMLELSAAALEGPGGYARAYETIVRLSSLSDIELINSLGDVIFNAMHETTRIVQTDLQNAMDTTLNLLDERIRISRPTFHTLEPVLAIQHAAIHLIASSLQNLNTNDEMNLSTTQSSVLTRLRSALGHNWLERARLARKSGQFMAAYTCVLRAEAFGIPDALLERSKLLWQTDKREAAQSCLDKGIPEVFGNILKDVNSKAWDDSSKQSIENRTISAQQALLLRARYCEDTNRFDFEATRQMYEEVCTLSSGCEEAHFRLAHYLDRARTKATVIKQSDALLKEALKHYGLALSYGSQYIYQSMPRLLTLWLDCGADITRHPGEVVKPKATAVGSDTHSVTDQKTFREIQELMVHNCERIPSYQFYTALSQILSRVCHEMPSVLSTLITLLVRIFEAYPLQTIWYLIPLHDSVVRQRRERCLQIFNTIKTKQPQFSKFISDCIALCNHLRTICGLFMTADRRELRSFSLRQTVRPITRLIESSDFSRILIPIHRQLVPNLLPARASTEDMSRHWPFGESPDRLVCLSRIDDLVEILGSQTRPKKMTWLGSDGRKYIIVAKPNDDLRKDSRLMELNGMINKFLVKYPETRRRALQIRTYAVIPLSEKGGLIEWVSNTQPFRSIITRLYVEIGKPINWANMSRVAPLLEDPLAVKRDKYLNKWLPMFPLVFHHWFSSTFTNPSAWYSARECYARTCAVMSMVGYVLGLGDRHTENILFDSATGGVVHVDFSCVFNNGLTLPWPERVPFRLTRNMVYALGPTGYEGIFRRCSEAVMRLLRHEIDPILAVFRPIYFDALVEQGGTTRGGTLSSEQSSRNHRTIGDNPALSENELTERVTRAATEKLAGMEDRLNGKITENDGLSQILPMSAEGQVDALIKEATDVDRLCQMYKGWMPFL